MPTRLYFPGPLDSPYTATPGAGWENTASYASRLAVRTKTTQTAATPNLTKGTTVANDDRLFRIYVTDPIAAQTIPAGTFSMVLKVSQSATTADSWIQVIIRVMSGDGVTQRGLLYAGSTATAPSATVGAENEEMPTTAATRIKNAIATTSVVAQDGDRLHIEIGSRGSGTTSTVSYTANWIDNAGNADFALTSGLTTTLNPWLELSADLAWMPTPQLVGRSNDKARFRATNW